jgi:chromosome segregation ATPase
MASEPTEEGVVTVDVPEGLDEWLDEQAAELGVSRDVLVTQLLSSYRATVELEGDQPLSSVVGFDVEAAVDDSMGDRIDAAAAASVDEQLDAAVSDRLPDLADAVESRLDDRFEQVEAEFKAKLDDVRERVIQLKRELETKADEDHDHEALEEVQDEVQDLSETVESLRSNLDEQISEVEANLWDLETQFDETEDRLERVAWVVSDLRKDTGGKDAHQKAVERIKRAAAQENVSTATCENCSESVDISLLTDPECPHCSTTVSDVRPEGGIFRKKARLVTAAQLEAGDTDE